MIAGLVFVIARILHPIGMDLRASNFPRVAGIIATWLVMAALAGWAIVIVANHI